MTSLVILVSFAKPPPQIAEGICRQAFRSDYRAVVARIIVHIE